jgi:acyl carrier protein
MEATKETIAKVVRDSLCEVTGEDYSSADLDARITQDLGVDSMNAIEIVIAIQNNFEIEIDDDEVPELTTINKIVARTMSVVKEKDA